MKFSPRCATESAELALDVSKFNSKEHSGAMLNHRERAISWESDSSLTRQKMKKDSGRTGHWEGLEQAHPQPQQWRLHETVQKEHALESVH